MLWAVEKEDISCKKKSIGQEAGRGSRLSEAGKAPGTVALIDPLFTTQSTVDGKAERILLLHKGSTIWFLSSLGSSSEMGESFKAGGLPTHGSMPSSCTWVKGMGRKARAGTGLGQVCICCPGIAAHTSGQERGMQWGTLLVELSLTVNMY